LKKGFYYVIVFNNMSEISNLIADFENDLDALSDLHASFDEREKFLIGDIYDSTSSSVTKSQVVDQTLLSGLIRRTNDVMAKIPTGKVMVLSKKDKGKALFLDLILQNYILPNANTQYDLYTKFWMVELLSLIYGKIDVLVDYVVREDYVGPDFYIIPPRCGIPQAGAISTSDASHYWVRSYVTREWLESRKGLKNWKNIDRVLEKVKKGSKKSGDSKATSYIERKYQSTLQKSDQIELINKYERDTWTTFCPQAQEIVRKIDNPHKNNELPIVSKICYPLLDRYFGLSEYERLITIQKAINTILNLGIDAQKITIYPPLRIFLPDVMPQTLKYEAGAKWVLKNNNINAISQMPVSPVPNSVFQQMYALTKAALFSGLGISDTTISAGLEPAIGKTPEALRIQQMMAAAHTGFDRRMLEIAAEKIFDKFLDLLITKQEKPIELYLSKEDIDEVKAVNPDIVEMFESGERGKIIIKPEEIKNVKYKFYIDAGTSVRQDDLLQNQTLTSILKLVLELPGVAPSLLKSGQVNFGGLTINFGEIFKRWLATAGVEGWEKMVENTQQPSLNQNQTPNIPSTNQTPVGQPSPFNFEPDITAGLPNDQKDLLSQIYGQSTSQPGGASELQR